MSVDAHRPGTRDALDALVGRAGGVLTAADGAPVAVSYGSATGELAALSTGVGLANRSELVKLELTGAPQALGGLARELAGVAPAPGGAVAVADCWWCAAGPARAVVVGGPDGAARLRRAVDRGIGRHRALDVRDRTAEWAAIAVLGRRARELLADLGVYGESRDPRQTAPVALRRLVTIDVLWLLASDRHALALMGRSDAGAVWRAIVGAGVPLGLCAVGRDAVVRYALLQRRVAAL